MLREQNRDFYEKNISFKGVSATMSPTKSRIFDTYDNIYPFNRTDFANPTGARNPNPKMLLKNAFLEGMFKFVVFAQGAGTPQTGTVTMKIFTSDSLDGEEGKETLHSASEPIDTVVFKNIEGGFNWEKNCSAYAEKLKRYIQVEFSGATMISTPMEVNGYLEYQNQ